MAEPIIIHALKQKRAEVSGRIADLEERTKQMRADLVHIDATLVLFDPEARPDEIRPKKALKGRTGYFKAGEISRRCREAVRVSAEPLSCDDVVRQTMVDKGLDLDDKVLRQDLGQRFLWALTRMAKTGVVARVGRGIGTRWESGSSV